MSHQVNAVDVVARPTVVVSATTTWHQFPTVWPELLDEVWTCLRAGGVERGCPNVMLYRDDPPEAEVAVEVGVVLAGPPPLTGRVVVSTLPAGPAAMTVHRGPYADLGTAHRAVHRWCVDHGRRPAGPRWEIYGPHRDDPAQLTTEVYWLLAGAS